MINHLWQSTIFAAVVWLLTAALRRNPARVRFWLWSAASAKFLVPFSLFVAAGSHVPVTTMAVAPVHVPVVVQEMAEPATEVIVTPTAASPGGSVDWPFFLWAVWLCGVLIVGIRFGREWMRMRAIVKKAKPMTIDLPVKAMVTEALLEPGVFGIFCPVLLLPGRITDRLSPAEFRAIATHELCHVRRRDNLWAAIHMATEAVFWFHPLIWWIGSRMVAERERACDEEVLRMGSEPEAYAEGILKVCELYVAPRLECVSGVTGADLKRRIEAIMKRCITRDLTAMRKAGLVAVGVATIALPVTLGVLHAQANPPRSAFEVATIKPAQPVDPARMLAVFQGGGKMPAGAQIDGLRAEYLSVDLKTLLAYAYGVKPDQISGPGWMSTTRFDIVALMPVGSTKEDAPKMLRTLLEERFRLTIHRTKAEHPVLALVVGKGGLKLKASAEKPVAIGQSTPLEAGETETAGPDGLPERRKIDMTTGSMVTDMGLKGKVSSKANPATQSTHVEFSMVTMAGFAEALTRVMPPLGGGTTGQQVVDMTGIEGNYDASFEIRLADIVAKLRSFGVDPYRNAPGGAGGPGNAPAAAPDDPDGGSSITDALRSMGLKLEPRKAMVDQIIVDRVEKTPTAN